MLVRINQPPAGILSTYQVPGVYSSQHRWYGIHTNGQYTNHTSVACAVGSYLHYITAVVFSVMVDYCCGPSKWYRSGGIQFEIFDSTARLYSNTRYQVIAPVVFTGVNATAVWVVGGTSSYPANTTQPRHQLGYPCTWLKSPPSIALDGSIPPPTKNCVPPHVDRCQ